MGVTLTQSKDAALGDRPIGNSRVGMRAVLSPGDDGQSVEHLLSVPTNRLHVRFTARRQNFGGTVAVLSQGFNTQGQEQFQATIDNQNTLTIRATDSVILAAPLRPAALAAWDCIEFGLDATLGEASLWVNGVLTATATGLSPLFSVQKIRLGVPRKHHNAVGNIHLDEWMLGDGYLGPVTVPPQSEHADDPARWLVVYNTADADSQVWAEIYRQARAIPHANLLGLNLPIDETISSASYATLLDQIETYLDLNRLRPTVLGILLGYRVPGYVNNEALDQRHPIGALLHTADSSLNVGANPVSRVSPWARPTRGNLAGVRLTSRIDAPTFDQALALSLRAQAFDATLLTAADQLYVEPIPRQPTRETVSDQLNDWFASLDRQRLRLHATLGPNPASETGTGLATLENDAFYWGWGNATPSADFFTGRRGPRAVCAQLRQPDVEATTLRSTAPTHWIDRAIAAGYAAAIAASQSTSTSVLPQAPGFFKALYAGWTIAEAWIVSQPFVRSGMYLVGDPLMKIQFPQAGWDVFGPLTRSEDLNPATPIAALPADTYQLKLKPIHTPREDTPGHYLVRHVDEHGRSESSFQPLSLGKVASQAAPAPPAPAWPTREHWPIAYRDQIPTALLRLPCAPQQLDLTRVELFNDQGDPPTAVPIDRHDPWISQRLPLAAVFTRYRWRLTAPGGVTGLTPWSAPIRHASPPLIPLTTPES